MQNDQLFQARQNRLISTVRVFLAAFAYAAVLIDPHGAGPSSALVTEPILAGYLALALAIAAVNRFWKHAAAGLFVPAFALDVAVAATVIFVTGGSTNPFVPLLLMAATLRWGWRGAAAITVVVLALSVPTGIQIYERFSGAPMDPQRFIIRVGNIIALGGMMVALVRYQERVSRDMMRLSGAPVQAEGSEQPPVLASLEHAAAVFALQRAAFVWGDPEEPGLTVSEIGPDGRRESAWPTAEGEPHPVLDGIDEPFVYDPQGPAASALGRDGRMAPIPCEVLESPVLARLAPTRALVLPVRASWFAGWMILPDLPQLDRESLALGSTVAAQAAVAIEAWRSLVVWRDAASAEERMRLGRDLHDGTLQFLAGAAMQLESVARKLGPAEEGAREQIRRLQEDLQAEQRQLRELIGASSSLVALRRRPADFQTQVQNLTAVLARRWSADISVEVDATGRKLPGHLVFELLQIVREAISNAVRHGQASAVAIRTARRDQDLELTIADNGVGMPVHGVFGMAELSALAVGPRVLRGRVAGLGGDLVIETGPAGTTLKITAPLAVAGVPT